MADDHLVADLVLEGGGVKGIGLVGALTVLEERGYRFHRVAGASAGAVVGALVAAGFRAAEIHRIMTTEVDYPSFRDESIVDHLGLAGKAWSVVFEQGVYEGRYLAEWLGRLLARKGVSTFSDLRVDDPGSTLPPYRLVVVASDISQGALRRFPWDYDHYDVSAPEALVVDAVRASTAIPLYYEPVKFRTEAGEESWLVDGGMLSNFPIDTFDTPPGVTPRWPTFGIKLSARPSNSVEIVNRVHDTVSLLRAMVATWTGFHDQMHLDDPSVVARTMFVDTTGVSATDFDLSAEVQQRLFDAGRSAAETFLDSWDWPRYLEQHRTTPPVGASDGR